MLVLTRQPGESIIIGDDITLVVVSVRGRDVRLGIDAPESVSVLRQELKDAPEETEKSA
jgi:carbon storage regulator